MKPKRHDFWDGLDAVVRELDDESSKMAARGELDEFEREWHDPIAKLSERSWFVDAKAVAKKIAEKHGIQASPEVAVRWRVSLILNSPHGEARGVCGVK